MGWEPTSEHERLSSSRVPEREAPLEGVTAWAIPAPMARLLGTAVPARRPEVEVPSGGLLTERDVKEIAWTG